MLISPDRRRRAKGITTIEVLVAVVITLMIGSLAVLSFGGTDRRALALEAGEVALFLQEARMRSQEAGRPIEIIVDDEAGLMDAGGTQFRFARGVSVTPPMSELILYPTGQSEGLALTLRKGEHSRQVTLDWLTGRVSVP
mgnify:CR=1 FL=1